MSAFDPKRTLTSYSGDHFHRAGLTRYDALSSSPGQAMRRRDFIKVIVGSAVASPLAAHAQQPAVRVKSFGLRYSDFRRISSFPLRSAHSRYFRQSQHPFENFFARSVFDFVDS